MFKKSPYNWSISGIALMALLGVVFSSDAKAGCPGGIEPITSVEDFCDVRCKDMSSIDLSDRPNLPARLTFNQGTIWPGPAQMPPGCDPNVIMTNGMNPGLGVRALHQQGITGTGVNVAIIDQAMYLDHPEFAGKITTYYDLAAGEQRSMHGPAVTSLLVGTNCGTAPGARVYYCAVRSWVYEVDYAQALNWIVLQNDSLPDSEKIRVVSVSAAPGEVEEGHPSEPGEPTWLEAYTQAEAAGILVLDCTSAHGFIGRCWYDANDPENVAKCTPGRRPGEPWFDPANILTPASLRTTAEEAFEGDHSYIYWSSPGPSWTRPYCAGVLAMGWQIQPQLTGDKMVDLLFLTAYTTESGAQIINPPAFISFLEANSPVIQLSPEDIEFCAVSGGPSPEPQTLSISNGSLGTLNWVIEYDCDWLEVNPDAGTSTGETDVNEVTLTVTALPLGVHNCELIISDPCATNDPQTVLVTLYVADANRPTIQSAIDDANDGDTVIVAPGVYIGDGNRDLDFKGKAITVRSINPQNPGVVAATIINCQGTETEPHRGFHFHNDEDANSILNGLTITNGYASEGGGIYCNNSSPTISNCVLVANSAGSGGYGGGIEGYDNSHPMVTNCTFRENSADWGAGMSNWTNCSPTLTKCTFVNNSANLGGGAIHNYSNNPTLTTCIFIGNSAGNWGGAVRNHTSSPTLFNCTFTANSATYGGAVHNENNSSNPTLINCTFCGNSAVDLGGGVCNSIISPSSPTLTNCIFWANTDVGGPNEPAQIRAGTPIVNYCCIQGWTGALGGNGNIGDDPNFIDADGPDDVAGTEDDNLRLSPGSPCIDAGDNISVPNDIADLDNDANTTEHIPYDLDGRPRFTDGDCNDSNVVDMGAYEFAWAYIGDFDYDCDVDSGDYAIFGLAWLTEPPDDNWNRFCDISLPADSFIDEKDLKIFTNNWLAGK